MQTSGQVSAQIAHPVQSSGLAKTAAAYPCALIFPPISMQFFGQAGTHSSHALHRSKSISMRPVAAIGQSYFGLNSKKWVVSIVRSVRDFERITMDWVCAPPLKNRTPFR